MEQWDRSISILVGPRGGAGRLLQNLHFKFKVEKSLESAPNPATIEIYNLAPETRAVIEENKSSIVLNVGYGGQLRALFTGDVAKVTTQSQGADLVTSIEAGDGEFSFQNQSADLSFGPGTAVKTVVDALIDKLGLAKGSITAVTTSSAQYLNGISLTGMVRDQLEAICQKLGLQWSIQDGQVQILSPDSATPDEVLTFSSGVDGSGVNTGLVGSPAKIKVLRQDLAKKKDGKSPESGVNFKCLINPEIRPGRRVKVVGKLVTGVYIVQKVTFTGDTHSNAWHAEVEAI